MATTREEAAPTFPTWKARLETAEGDQLEHEVSRFLEILKALGTPMIDGPEVNFVYHGPNATNVSIIGEFNEWGRNGPDFKMMPIGKTGFFYHTLTLGEPARLEYKFIVDSQWQIDPFCPNQVENGLGESNSYFIVGDFQEPPELQWNSDIAHGRVEQFEFKSRLLGNSRQVYVYLPAIYDSNRRVRFPSFYLHDGGEYLERARMANVLDNLMANSEIPPLLVVMVDPVNRMQEYWANPDYTEFLYEELLPHIDDRYRTVQDRKARGVMGASLGGLISVYTALSRPKLFSLVAGQSSALQIEQQKLVTALKGAGRGTFRFYFDVGKYEPGFIPAHEKFVSLLKKKRWPTLYQVLPGGHNWTSWRAHLKDLLVFLWRPEPSKRRAPVRRTRTAKAVKAVKARR